MLAEFISKEKEKEKKGFSNTFTKCRNCNFENVSEDLRICRIIHGRDGIRLQQLCNSEYSDIPTALGKIPSIHILMLF